MDDILRQRILRQHLQTDALLGVDVVPVGEVREVESPVPEGEAIRFSIPAQPDEHRSRPARHLSPQPERLSASTASQAHQTGTPASAEQLPDVPDPAPRSSLTPEQQAEALAALDEQQVRGCTLCKLCEGRTQTVFGDGSPSARLMFIGEGPGENEDLQGKPFVGRAGDLLNKMIVAMGLSRETVYIGNVVKCRPPGNRTPTPAEVETCWPYLKEQIRIIQPAVIVTLGGPAAKMLLGTKTGITRLRGIWHLFRGLEPDGPVVPVMPTFHPAYLLRNYTKETRAKVWADLKAAMNLLERDATG